MFKDAANRRWQVVSNGSGWLVALSCALVLSACGEDKAATPQPPEVVVRTLQSQNTEIPVDIVAELKAYQEVELRPRVSGIVMKQSFRPGQSVKQGDLLFSIDPRQYDESVLNSQASLAEAQAKLSQAMQDVARYKPLLPDNAIPRQTYDQAVATQQQSKALVDARRAQLEQAKLDRSYCEVRSPVSGQIGLQQVEVGSLASSGQTLLAVVSTLDPMLAYFSIPESEYLVLTRRWKKEHNKGEASSRSETSDNLRLILADNSEYPYPGKVDFVDRAINSTTGTLTLRAVFPNDGMLLRPGLNARVRAIYEVEKDAILVPQKAVTELLGKRFCTVIGADNKAEQRPIVTGARLGNLWLVKEGLKAGERVVVEGLQKARQGVTVKPVDEAEFAAKHNTKPSAKPKTEKAKAEKAAWSAHDCEKVAVLVLKPLFTVVS